MSFTHKTYQLSSIAIIFIVAMFFSCTNDAKEVRDFLAEKNLPIGVAKNAVHFYKDSGFVTSKLETSLMYDFSNRKDHPYNEFPQGVLITSYENKGKDSVTVLGDYAISYKKTFLSEIKGSVIVTNHTSKSILKTDQLFWDQKSNYFFTEKQFVLITETDTVNGIGFESKEDLTKVITKKTFGNITTKEDQ